MNARQELLRRRLERAGPARWAVAPRPDPDAAPLTAAQHRMWLHQRLHPASSAYNVCILLHLDGDLDEARLISALAKLVDRHEVLRSTYGIDTEGRPYQRIHPVLPAPISIVDEADPALIAAQAASEPFDLASSGPIRFHLVRNGAARWSLILAVHHVVWDGGCFGVFSRDLGLAYRGDERAPPQIQYADIAAHDARPDATAAARTDGQLAHWRRTLSPPPLALPLPYERPQGPDVGESARRADRTMAPACAVGLGSLAVALGSTPFTVFIAAYALLLARWTGGSDIVIGTMVANRHRPGTSDLIGNFGNTVLLRLDLAGNPTFAELVERATGVIQDALGNADVAFERVVEDLAPPRESGHSFFTDTLGLFLDRDIDGPDLPGVDVRWDNVFNAASPFALTFQGFLTGGALRVEATYREALFDPATVLGMLEHLETILLAAIADPARACSVVGALPHRHSEELVRLSNGAEAGSPVETVLGHWRRRVDTMPGRSALSCGVERYSYAGIDARAKRLAGRLVEAGVRAGDVVGVALRRGAASMVAPLAVWTCGAVYLPLDREHPEARLRDVLAAANARLAIGELGFSIGPVPTLVIDDEALPEGVIPSCPSELPHPLDAAHITFTSGSTGRPKGVVTTHASLAARTCWVASYWPSGGARLARSVPTAIDATAELCEAIVTGETLVLATDAESRDAAAIAGLLDRHRIGHVMAVPGLLEAITVVAPGVISTRDRIMSTGEPLLPRVARSIHAAAPGVKLHNSYGCSETTGDVAAGPIGASDLDRGGVAIGGPLPGSRCYVLAADLSLAPLGVRGELYVEGAQLARGYLGQPAATATRFVANPFSPGDRLYRTGDLARWRPDGQLELLGRGDDQVNVRGHRVEAAETVAALHTLPRVREAVVLPRGAGTSLELVAFVSGDDLGPADGPALREALAQRLPGPLVPSWIAVLTRLPRLEGGKFDRQALARSTVVPDAQSRQPRSAHETVLARLLGELLGRGSVGIDDNFFGIGGDSLMAVSFAARAAAAGLAFPAADVFRFPTVAQLAERLPPPPGTPMTSLQLPPPTHRFRLSDVPVAKFVTWHVLASPVEPGRLRQALADTIARHAPLRQAIVARGRFWRSRAPSAPADGTDDAIVIELSRCDDAGAIAAARSAIDLAAGRALVAVTGPDMVMLVAHPAAVDGLSLARIAAEIEANARGEALPPHRAVPLDGSAAPHPDWDAVLASGPGSPWWIGSDAVTPPGPSIRVSASADMADEARVTEAFLHALHQVSRADLVLADIEVEPGEIGPLFAVPMAGRTGTGTALGNGHSYAAYIASRRPLAGGAGVLLRRTVSRGGPGPYACARGADRLYHIAAAWQPLDSQIALEVTADTVAVAEDLVAAWKAALHGSCS